MTEKNSETNSLSWGHRYSACMSGTINNTPARIEVELTVTLEGECHSEKAIIQKIYEICPFSKAIKSNAQTTLHIM
jgi:organic hydroperoxide reductase OsmC/OhrA